MNKIDQVRHPRRSAYDNGEIHSREDHVHPDSNRFKSQRPYGEQNLLLNHIKCSLNGSCISSRSSSRTVIHTKQGHTIQRTQVLQTSLCGAFINVQFNHVKHPYQINSKHQIKYSTVTFKLQLYLKSHHTCTSDCDYITHTLKFSLTILKYTYSTLKINREYHSCLLCNITSASASLCLIINQYIIHHTSKHNHMHSYTQ